MVLAFLDANPLSNGHTLVVPKKHAENIFDIEEEYLERIFLISKKIAQKMKTSLGIDGVNLYHASGVHAEQTVFHFHLHIIPRKQDDNICFTRAITKKTNISDEEFRAIADKLKIEK